MRRDVKICCSSHVLQTDTKICDTIKKKKQFPILFFTCYKFKKEVGQNSKWWAIQEFLNDFAKVLLLLLLDNSRMLVSNWTCQQLFVHHSQNTEKLTFFKIVSRQVIIRLSITNMLYWFDVQLGKTCLVPINQICKKCNWIKYIMKKIIHQVIWN